MIFMRMRRSHKTILVVCTLFFTNAVALKIPYSIDLLPTPTSIPSAVNLTHSENLLPHATATTVGAQNCYPSNVPVSYEAWRNCSEAIWLIPPDPIVRIFDKSDFPIYHKYGGCVVTLRLFEQDTGTWEDVEWSARNVWLSCQIMYPQTLMGASTLAGSHGKMFVRIWYEGSGSGVEGVVAARRIGDDGVERENELSDLSEEG